MLEPKTNKGDFLDFICQYDIDAQAAYVLFKGVHLDVLTIKQRGRIPLLLSSALISTFWLKIVRKKTGKYSQYQHVDPK